MRSWKTQLLAGIFCVQAAGLAGMPAYGGIALVTQGDGIQISGSAADITQTPVAAGTPFSQSSTATVNSPFNASLQNSSVADADETFTGSASQQSLLSVSSTGLALSASG